jgi:hypothetical protein
MSSHVDRSQALKQDHMSSHVDRSQALKQDDMSSHVDRSQALKQEHMNSHVEYLKHRSAQFDPSVLQPNVYNALYSTPSNVNKQTSPNTHTENPFQFKKCSKGFISQAMKQFHLQSHAEVPKHECALFEPSVLQPNVYSSFYSDLH